MGRREISGLRTPIAIAGSLLLTLAVGGPAAAQEDELAAVREATAAYQTVEAAEAAGYELGYVNGSGDRIVNGCVAREGEGAMGFHYLNKALLDDPVVDPLRPEALVYAPQVDGSLRLVAVEWVVRGPESDPPGVPEAPEVIGQTMRILVPAVGWWTQHAWIWDHNPSGVLADWNPWVSCPVG